VDPCAGEGAAVLEIAGPRSTVLACELERTRFRALAEALKRRNNGSAALHGDAFRVDFDTRTDLLYLNPPYDLDPEVGRLEERFLARWTNALRLDGVLVFVVPHYALKASADTIANNYRDVTCWRFPDSDFSAYSQVVVFGVHAPVREPDETRAAVLRWAESVADVPVLERGCVQYRVAGEFYGMAQWSLRAFDEAGLMKRARIWRVRDRLQERDVLPRDPKSALLRRYDVATIPRPAHIAAGISSGIFNGRKVSAEGFPDLLVKGVFDREFVTVEEKQNQKGEVTQVVQVQQPKLVVTVLDLEKRQFHQLKMSSSGSREVENFGVEDLLKYYGPALMRVMLEQCPARYDVRRDSDKVKIAPLTRGLFWAQEQAAKALVKLYRDCPERRGNILLGEIGSGKTTIAVTVAKTLGSRVLVLCPPHLLRSWENEIRACTDANVIVLKDAADVQTAAGLQGLTFAILSRETAKLGHAHVSLTGSCPACGAPIPEGDHARTRKTCDATTITPTNEAATLTVALTREISRALGVPNRFSTALERRWFARARAGQWRGIGPDLTARLTAFMNGLDRWTTGKLRYWLTWACQDYTADVSGNYDYDYKTVLAMRPGERVLDDVQQGRLDSAREHGFFHTQHGKFTYQDGEFLLDDTRAGSVEAARVFADLLYGLATWRTSKPCRERLYSAVPEPRRIALAPYIAKRFRGTFDFMIVDECHEYANQDSAQGFAVQRLSQTGIKTLAMTGSIMNGYAKSMFQNFWNISPEFRAEFDYDSVQAFCTRYGYRKQVVSEKDLKTGDIVAYGSQSDRVVRQARVVGDAPGVLPLLLFRHLLPIAVTVQKEDLALDLPDCRQIVEWVPMSPEQAKSAKMLQRKCLDALKQDRFQPERAGRLLGALAELPSYLDRATAGVGNQPDGSYQIRYPDALGGELVATGESFPPDELLPKEEWLIARVSAELAEGRNVMVFCWHVNLLPRLKTVLEHGLKIKTETLHASKVPTAKRQDWIDAKVVRPGVRVMLANPVTVQTGLNNLVHFSSEIWYENPACNPTVFRQAIGRVDRIGQKLETRIYTPVYEASLQEITHTLLLKKAAVSLATDGLDPEAALRAAGAVEDQDGYVTSLSIGRSIWAMLEQ
jgi:hypothetical protein